MEILGVEHVVEVGVGPAAGDKLSRAKRLAILRLEHAVAALGYRHYGQLFHLVENPDERNEVKSGAQNARLRSILAVEGDDLPGLHVFAQVDAL